MLLALEVPLGIQNSRTERRDLEAKVEHDATNLASIAQTAVGSPIGGAARAVASIASRYSAKTGGRVVVVGRDGIALVDTSSAGSRPRDATPRDPRSPPRCAASVAQGVRHSATLNTDLLYVAVPVAAGGVVDGAVRITYPTSTVDARIRRYWLILLAIAAIVLALAALVGVRLAAFVIRPLRDLEQAAAAVGDGDLAARAPEDEGPPEVRSLARGLQRDRRAGSSCCFARRTSSSPTRRTSCGRR